MAKYRHELKYYLSHIDYINLQKRLSATVPRDPNVDKSGKYFIRSLYFDDPFDSCLQEKFDGADNRDKFRLRFYNMQPDKVKLERKRKTDGYISKDSLPLTKPECEAIMNKDYAFLLNKDDSFAHVMYTEFVTKQLRPCVIVDYVREPFVFPYEDVRLTFDTEIRTGFRSVDLFNPDIPTYPVIENDSPVLEVKFNKAMPKEIYEIIQSVSPLRSQVSKYCLCRQYEL